MRRKMIEDIKKLAIDDARQRQKALFDLILATDRQAMTFFGFCISIAAASVAGFVASWSPDSRIPAPAASALLVIFLGFGFAGFLCLRVMKSAPIGLPGRKAEFWKWALATEANGEASALAYVDAVEVTYSENAKNNRRMARLLEQARLSVIAACALAPFVGLLVHWRHWAFQALCAIS